MSVWPSVRPDGPYVLAGGILLSSSSALPPPTFELLVNPMWGLGCGINQRGEGARKWSAEGTRERIPCKVVGIL